MRRLIPLGAALAVLLLGGPGEAPSAEPRPSPTERVLHVPTAEWEHVRALAGEGALLRWSEYRELWTAAQRGLAGSVPSAPPRAFLMTYDGEATPEGARLTLRAEARAYAHGTAQRTGDRGASQNAVAAAPLEVDAEPRLRLGAVRLDGRPCALTPDTPRAAIVPAAPEGAWHRLTLEGSVPITRRGPWREALLPVPPAVAVRYRVVLPGARRVEANGAAVSVDVADGRTRVEVFPDRTGPVTLRWTAGAGAGGVAAQGTGGGAPTGLDVDERTVVAFGEGHATVAARIDVQIHGGAVSTLAVALPPGLQPLQVSAPELRAWSVRGEEPRRTLELVPERPRSGPWSIALVLDGPLTPSPEGDGVLSLPPLTVVGEVTHGGAISVLAPPELTVRAVARSDTRRLALDAAPKLADIAPELPGRVPGTPLDARLGLLRPSGNTPVELAYAPAAPTVSVDVASALDVDEDAVQLTAVLAVEARGGPAHELILRLPEGFTPRDIFDEGAGQPAVWRAEGDDTVRVRLVPPVAAGASAHLRLVADTVPAGWGDEGRARWQVPLPIVSVVDAARLRGHVGVSAPTAFELTDGDLDGLIRKDIKDLAALGIQSAAMRLGYRYASGDAAGVLHVQRAPARTASVTTIVTTLQDGLVRHHVEAAYALVGEGVREVRLRLPAAAGSSVHFACPDGPPIQERLPIEGSPEATPNGSAEDTTEWRILFQGRARGVFHVVADWERPLAGDAAELAAPLVEPLHEGRRQRVFVVEASPDLEVESRPDGLAELDLGEVPPLVSFTQRHRLVAAFRAVRPDGALRLGLARHEEVPVLATYIDAARAESVVGRDGTVRTAVTYDVRNTRAQYLALRMPDGARIWSVHQAGEPRKPIRVDGTLRVPLSAGADDGPGFDGAPPVRIVYETRGDALGALARPRLALPEPDGVPVGEQRWTVRLPEEYTLLHADGLDGASVTAPSEPPVALMALALGEFVLRYTFGAFTLSADMDKAVEEKGIAPPPVEPVMISEEADETGVAVVKKAPAKPSYAKDDKPRELDKLEEIADEEEQAEGAKPDSDDEAVIAMQRLEATITTGKMANQLDANKQLLAVPPVSGTETAEKDAAGLLSLDVELAAEGVPHEFHQLGAAGALTLTVAAEPAMVTARRVAALLSIALLLLVTRRRRLWPAALGFVCAGTALALVAPALPVPALVVPANGFTVGAGAAWLLLGLWRVAPRLWRRAWRWVPAAAVTAESAGKAARGVGAAILLAAVLTVGASPAQAAKPGAPAPELAPVIAPFGAEGLPSATPERVFVPRGTFEALMRAAATKLPATEVRSDAAEPAPYALGAARYDAQLRSSAVEVDVALDVDVFARGWVEIPLALNEGTLSQDGTALRSVTPPQAGTALRSVTVDGAPAALTPSGAAVALRGPGRHTLRLTLSLPADGDGDGDTSRGAVTLPLPLSAAARVRFASAGRDTTPSISLPDGAAALGGPGTPATLDAGGATSARLAWSPARTKGTLSGGAGLHVTPTVTADVAVGSARVEATLALTGAGAGPLAVTLPPGLTPLDVRGDGVTAWNMAPVENDPTAAEGSTLLTIVLGPGPDARRLSLLAALAGQNGAPPTLGPLTVRGARAAPTTLVLSAAPALALRPTVRGLTRADARDLPAQLELRPTRDALLYRSAFADWSVALVAAERDRAVDARIDTAVVLDGAELYASARITLTPESQTSGPLSVTLDLPADVELARLEAPGLSQRHRLPGDSEGRQRLELLFVRPVQSDAPLHLLLEGRPGADGLAEIPVIHVVGARREAGAVAVTVKPGLTLSVAAADGLRGERPEEQGDWSRALTAEVPDMAFSFDAGARRLQVRVAETPARLAATCRADVTVEDGALRVRQEVEVEVLQGAVETVTIAVPAAAGDPLLSGADVRGHDVEESGESDGDRRWTVRLHGAERQRTTLTLDYELPLGPGAKVVLPRVRPLAMERIREEIVVRNASRGELALGPTGLEALPLDAAGPGPFGGRPVSRLRAAGDSWSLGLTVRDLAAESILEASVDLAELDTVIGRDGVARTRASYRLQNRGEQFLRLRLPEKAALWSVTVADQGVRPVTAGDQLLVPLIRTSAGDLSFEVTVVYAERLVDGLGTWEALTPGAPVVEGVPVAHTVWQVRLPQEWTLDSTDGNVQRALDMASVRLRMSARQEELRRLDQTIATGDLTARQNAYDNIQLLVEEYNRDADLLGELQKSAQTGGRDYGRYENRLVRKETQAAEVLLNESSGSAFGNFELVEGKVRINPTDAQQGLRPLSQQVRIQSQPKGALALLDSNLFQRGAGQLLPQGNIANLDSDFQTGNLPAQLAPSSLEKVRSVVVLDEKRVAFNSLVTQQRKPAKEGEYKGKRRKKRTSRKMRPGASQPQAPAPTPRANRWDDGYGAPTPQPAAGLGGLGLRGVGRGGGGAGPGAGGLGLDGLPAGGDEPPALTGAAVAGVHALRVPPVHAGTAHHFSKLGGGATLTLSISRADVQTRVWSWLGAGLCLGLLPLGLWLSRRQGLIDVARRWWPWVALVAGLVATVWAPLPGLQTAAGLIGLFTLSLRLVRRVFRRAETA